MISSGKQRSEGSGVPGLVFGAVVSGLLGYYFAPPLSLWTLGVIVITGALLGWRYGDAVWSWILERVRYFL